MKSFLAVLLSVLISLPVCTAATPGPEIAVIQIRFGKEKQFQRVAIALYDEAAPLTVANFKDLITANFTTDSVSTGSSRVRLSKPVTR